MNLHWKKYLSIFVLVFCLYLSIHYWSFASGFLYALFCASTPILIGCAVAYLVNILMSFYERHYFKKSKKRWIAYSRRPVCMIGAMLTLFAVVALVIMLVVPQLSSCISLVVAELPVFIEKLVKSLSKNGILPKDIMAALSGINWQERIVQIAQTILTGAGNLIDVVISVVSSLASTITTAVVAFIFAIYLLSGKERLTQQGNHFLQHYLPEKWYKKIMYVLSLLNESFHKFIVGQFTEAIILGLLCTIGMLILRLPYASMIGTLIGFTALIPVVGAFIGGAVGAFLILMESPVQTLIFLVFLIILQQLEGNLIYPRVVGTSIGLPSIWVLAVVTLSGSVFGILGILFCIPLAAAFYRLIWNDMHKPKSVSVDTTDDK